MKYYKELSQKNIVIFGASRGIGLNISKNLLSKVSNLIISSGNEINLNRAFSSLKKQGSINQTISKTILDLRLSDPNFGFFNKLEYKLDAIIICSAVLGPSGNFSQTNWLEWVNTFNVNLFGIAKLLQHFLKSNLIERNGKIIVMSGGISGPDPYFNSFSATKHALYGFVNSLAHQLSSEDIWVNSVLPGSYHTQMNKIRIERGPENIGCENFKIALSRVYENESEKYKKLNSLVEFLCSSKSDKVYGRLISAQYDDWETNIERIKDNQDELYRMVRAKD